MASITNGLIDKDAQKRSLAWIRELSMSPKCIESLATRDAGVIPHVIEF